MASDFNFFILLKDLSPKTLQKYRIVAQAVDLEGLIADWNDIMQIVYPLIKEKEVDGVWAGRGWDGRGEGIPVFGVWLPCMGSAVTGARAWTAILVREQLLRI